MPSQSVSTYADFSSAPVVIVISASPLSYLHWLWLSLLLLQKVLEDDTLYSSEQTADLSVGIADSIKCNLVEAHFFLTKTLILI